MATTMLANLFSVLTKANSILRSGVSWRVVFLPFPRFDVQDETSHLTLCVQVQKAVKKSARREQLQREEMEQRRLRTVLELQFLLDQLGDDSVRQDLKRPDASGSPLLSDADLTSLDELYKLMGPDRNYDVRYEGAL